MLINYNISIFAEKNDRNVKLAEFKADCDLTKDRYDAPKSVALVGGNICMKAVVYGASKIFKENHIPLINVIVIFDNRYHQITLRDCSILLPDNNALIYSESVREVAKT